MEASELITDEFQSYNVVGREMRHSVIHHKRQFADGDIHTNTIEGFWSLLKERGMGHITTIALRMHHCMYQRHATNITIEKNTKYFGGLCLRLWDGKLHNPKSKTTNCDLLFKRILKLLYHF